MYLRAMHPKLLPSVLFLLLQACSAPEPAPLPSSPTTPEAPLLQRLPGAWVHEEPESDYSFEEHWGELVDGRLSGTGIVRDGKDTIMIEHLAIQVTDSGTWYSARIPTQNDGDPVFFRMEQDVDSLVFANPDHDYPQRIAYLPQADGSWHVRLNGMRNGTAVEERLRFVHMQGSKAGTH